jgi:hypothetical protein
MQTRTWVVLAGAAILAAQAPAQDVLFDFDNAPLHTSLPIDLTAGGVTAQFSATAQGFSIQWANAMGFTPAGFSGSCIYPNSVFAADLLIGLGCDDSARLAVGLPASGWPLFMAFLHSPESEPKRTPQSTLGRVKGCDESTLCVLCVLLRLNPRLPRQPRE